MDGAIDYVVNYYKYSVNMYCLSQDVADNQIDSGDLMECLIQNKHQKDMNEKCAIGVTHFQLVSRFPGLITEYLPAL